MDPGQGAAPEPATTYVIRKQPMWTYFLTPLAVIIGAVLIGGAIFLTDDETSTAGAVLANATLPASVASVGPQLTGQQATLLSTFNGYAQSLGLDVPLFQTCLAQPSNVDLITGQLQQGSTLGVNGTPTFFINNKKIVGAQPAAIFDEVIDAELNGSPGTLEGYSAGIQALAAANPPRFEIVDRGPDVSGAELEGPESPRVVIVEFSDFQCPFCKQWVDQTLPSLRSEWQQKGVALAFLHFPLTAIHPNAGNAAVAAVCAGQQGAFWGMHDMLFARQVEWQGLAN
jgi:protein-disulfide isomerase